MASARRVFRVLVVLFSGTGALGPAPAAAQQPSGEPVTIVGVVFDGASGAPVAGAFLSLDERVRAIADSLGGFRFEDVALGSHELVVQRFGYLELTLDVSATAVPAPLEIRLQADPLAISGLTVTGGVQVALSGLVRDAVTDQPIPWASVALSEEAFEPLRPTSGDERGVFRISGVETGAYYLTVERIGYVGQLWPIQVTAPPTPVEIRLQPDTALQRGIEEYEGILRNRRSSTPFLARTYGEEYLRFSAALGMRQFLEQTTFLAFFRCSSGYCVSMGGRTVRPSILIDDLVAYGGLDELDSYSPEELHSVEVVSCGRRSMIIQAYTYDFIERMGRRPRRLFPFCFPI